MGKHWGNSTCAQSKASGVVARSLAAAAGVALAVLVFGPSAPAGTSARDVALSPLATGSAGAGLLAPGSDEDPGGAARGTSRLTADWHALISFARTTVQTTSKDGVVELRVASAGLSRPPKGFLMAPLETLLESSPFGLRTSPLTGTAGEFHWGQDFAAPCGTRVYSADAGVVRAVGWHPWGGGNRVEIDHGNGLITTYNHLQGIAVTKGESVGVDEVIAKVGTTGSSTGCHLHFETILNGSHTNPLGWKFLPTRQVDPLDNIKMVSYAPGVGRPGSDGGDWAVPVSEDHTHAVTGGVQEKRVPEATGTAAAKPSPTATASPLATPAVTPTPSASTPTPSASTPPPAVTPAPTPSATTPPTPTPTPTAPSTAPPPTPTPTVTDPASAPTGPAPTAPAAPEETAATEPTGALVPEVSPTP